MTSLMPKSFVGYGLDLSRNGMGLFVKVCAWCADKAEMDAWAAKKKLATSHSCCPTCAQVMMAAVTGESHEQ